MPKFFKAVIAIFCIIIALVSGGCSLVFTSTVMSDQGGIYSAFAQFWLGGFALAGAMIWVAYRLLRSAFKGPAR